MISSSALAAFGPGASIQNLQQEFMQQFLSTRITFPAADDVVLGSGSGRYPFMAKILLEGILNWTPTGAGKIMSAQCDIELWRQRILDSRASVSSNIQGGLVQKYLQECGPELGTGETGGLQNALKILSINYDIQDHPFLRRVILNLPGNIRLKGLLGLKGDMKRRPFVIMRLGVFGTIEEFRAERAWLMMLFEQSPFNILVLENMTSGDFASRNRQFAFGGYDEGIQNILVAKMLRDENEPLSKIIESVHLFGVSLGGHGVLFSSLLNKYNSSVRGPLIQSTLAFCPVINLKETMQSLFKGGFKTTFVNMWSRRRLKGLEHQMPKISEDKNSNFLETAIEEVTRKYTGGLSYVSSLVRLPPGMKDSSNFWELNDFWKYYQDVEEPVLVFATEKDPIVPFELNSQALALKNIKIASKNLRVVDFPMGYHCTLPVPYDWKFITTMMQSYILSHSSKFALKERSLDVDLSDSEFKGLFEKPAMARFEIEEPGKSQEFVNLQVSVGQGLAMDKVKHMNLSLPLADFDFRFFNKELTSSERQMIVRWLNQNIHVNVKQGDGKAMLKVSWPVPL